MTLVRVALACVIRSKSNVWTQVISIVTSNEEETTKCTKVYMAICMYGYLDILDEIFNRCSEEIRVFKEAFEEQFCADSGDLSGYLDDDGDLSK